MAKDEPLTHTSQAVVLVASLAAGNYLAAKLFGYPFVYCWAGPPARVLYLDWGLVVAYVVVAYTLYSLARKNHAGAFIGFMVFLSLMELPRLVDVLFRVGGSCG
ncbi:hypothetical protein EN866_19630 [Mesorhizobium sp. M2D.F.Ca.ET.223.01.1.1]|uniref:hypothetical protein n=1 Tax=unclassified Mesorhizobium TaxID=325217 RepID=UPI000FCC9C35|nr:MULTISPECIES: hypothetical protein [unclassified Mesorhizobium]TGP89373.1 hypothetical protein EN864_19640 [bacterium M00.F.Ca.ET.221.01.1.1]TGP94746.1 hypothetical protein EN865_15510 [bacterium M00.F.Ca.ET.222.01.1.1]RVD58840.1 hypothetical protein EN783_14485 [Mesorhizobium sp. M2D.F.Ca.ET.140.01.1.1]TGP27868.1 hypothetical protein EN875_032965 [Mesorhizobium sp. M2D.F.Ca.ET.232.01.1.1]TGP75914.1 hypothetical protein EN867_15510 [Mesorhizobium sp. M2D.F.Ca.ET.224.01.1.1]